MTSPLQPRPSQGVEIEAMSGIEQAATSGVGRYAAIAAGIGLLVFLFSGGSTVGLVLLVGGIGVGVVALLPSIRAALGWRAATLVLPAIPLSLGSRPVAVYRRTARKVRDVPTCTVTCRVVCEERAEYRQSTNTRTEVARVYEQTFSGPGSGTPRGLEATVPLEVPSWVGAPTFDLGHNEVRWYIVATIDGHGLPDDEQRFPIVVGPALDPEVRNEVGDR